MNEEMLAAPFVGKVRLEYISFINYAIVHNGFEVCDYCELTNESEERWTNVTVSLFGDEIKRSEVYIDHIDGKQTVRITDLSVMPELNTLIKLTEGVNTLFALEIKIGGEVAYMKEYPIRLMTYDQWLGARVLPELMATFVTPHHPLLARVCMKAATFMEKWTGSSDLDKYQTQDPNRVRMQVAAVFEALRAEGLVYAVSPDNFECEGQRVRLVDQVLTEKMGHCLDLTMLFASCLEAIGLHPLLILLSNHIFVGAWLIDETYTHTIGDDSAFLLKGCSDGVNDLVLVESTMLAGSGKIGFEDAVQAAIKQLKGSNTFRLFVDVERCRLHNILPLPSRVGENGQWLIKNEGIARESGTKQLNRLSRYEIKIDTTKQQMTKQMIWERKLLDISLRNNLINIRLGKRVVPLISFMIERWEDHLQSGGTFQILPSPTTRKIEPMETGVYDSSVYKDHLGGLVAGELNSKRLLSYLTEIELKHSLTFLYRTSRTALEENGANSLFLVLGMLKWYESEKSVRPRFAPLLLLPIDIVRQSLSNGGTYSIKTRDEDIIFNTTLIELLKQYYGIDLSRIQPLPQDHSGVDVPQVFAMVRASIRALKGWDLIEEAMIGLFSFNKFVMWNDIHTHADKLKENPILASLMEQKILWQDDGNMADARVIDKAHAPKMFAVPLEVDSSQLEAVIDSGEGKTFILHGPPGTGKSQTITNMIANALYQGKRVLFVAEKMAALSVVQKRLERLRLAPFCLELHSNKATKSHILEQLQQVLELPRIQSSADFEVLSEDLYQQRMKLVGYVEALHEQQPSGFSLHDHILAYLNIEGQDEILAEGLVSTMTKQHLRTLTEALTQLDTVFRISGHPHNHPLADLLPSEHVLQDITVLRTTLGWNIQSFDALADSVSATSRYFSLSLPETLEAWTVFVQLIKLLMSLPEFNERLIEVAKDKVLQAEWSDYLEHGRQRDALAEEIKGSASAEILKEDPIAWRKSWYEVKSKWLLPRYFAQKSYLKRLRFWAPDLQLADIDAFWQQIAAYHEQQGILDARRKDFELLFGRLARVQSVQWDVLAQLLESLSSLYDVVAQMASLCEISVSELFALLLNSVGNNWGEVLKVQENSWERLVGAHKDYQEASEELKKMVQVSLPTTNIKVALSHRLRMYQDNLERIKDWNHWCLHRQELIEQGLSDVVRLFESESLSGRDAAQRFERAMHLALAKHIIASDSQLRGFNGLLFGDIISKYKSLIAQFQELTKHELYCRLAARVPQSVSDVSANSEVGILKRNIANGGRGTSIRRLLDQIPTLLPKLCPCMLMSPMSVAQYIDLNAEKFDLVIFDEASQMPTSEAVGAIARGKSLIVVGDPKQMPPTSFFSSSHVGEEDADIDDMESILDDCIALSIPSRY